MSRTGLDMTTLALFMNMVLVSICAVYIDNNNIMFSDQGGGVLEYYAQLCMCVLLYLCIMNYV